jgi:hypothetical protein
VVRGRAGRPGDQRALAVGTDHQSGLLAESGAVAVPPADAADPAVAGDDELVDGAALPHLGARLAGRVDHDRVEDGAARAVDGVDALEAGEAAIEHHAGGVEADPAGGRGAGGGDAVEQAPAPQPGRPWELDLMGRQGVARKARPVRNQHVIALPCQQHRRGRAGDPGPDDDHVAHPVSPVSVAAPSGRPRTGGR